MGLTVPRCLHRSCKTRSLPFSCCCCVQHCSALYVFVVWAFCSACPIGSVLPTDSIVWCCCVHNVNLLPPLSLLCALMACITCFVVRPSEVPQNSIMSLIRNWPCLYVYSPLGLMNEKHAHASSCFAISRGVQNACIACLCCEVAEALPCVAMASLMPVSRCCCALL